MQRYPVRTTHRAHLKPEELVVVAREAFESAEISEGSVRAHYGALVELRAAAEGKELRVEVTMDPKVSVDVAQETVRRYNRFLESATGFTSKERAKRLRKSATGA